MPIVPDMLVLHDYIQETAPEICNAHLKNKGAKRSSFGNFEWVEKSADNAPKFVLPFSGKSTSYWMKPSAMFIILNAFEPLIHVTENGVGFNLKELKAFWDNHGGSLFEVLLDHYAQSGSNPNKMGKTKTAWTGMRNQTVSILYEKMRNRV